MKPVKFQFEGAYFDPSGQGFTLAPPSGMDLPPSRQRSIVAVCWNQADDRVFFINGAGLVVPSEHNRYELAPLLLRRRVGSDEYGAVIGAGHFAMKPAERKALESSGRIKQWVVTYLDQPAGYLDDAATWTAYLARELDRERDYVAGLYDEAQRPLLRNSRIALPWVDSVTGEASDLESATRQALDERRKELETQRREALAADARLGAWLRGEVATPPLLALMDGNG